MDVLVRFYTNKSDGDACVTADRDAFVTAEREREAFVTADGGACITADRDAYVTDDRDAYVTDDWDVAVEKLELLKNKKKQINFVAPIHIILMFMGVSYYQGFVTFTIIMLRDI